MNLNSLYGQLIMDHNKHPRNEGELADCSHQGVGRNPVCGDSLRITLRVEKGVLEDIKFKGVGCAISQSSASLLTEAVKGKSVEEVQMLLGSMFQLFTEGKAEGIPKKLTVFSGVHEFPARVKCASLAWHTLEQALVGGGDVSTE